MSNSYPTAREVNDWAQTTWRLKGGLMVAFMNQDLFLMEFDFRKKQKGFWIQEENGYGVDP